MITKYTSIILTVQCYELVGIDFVSAFFIRQATFATNQQRTPAALVSRTRLSREHFLIRSLVPRRMLLVRTSVRLGTRLSLTF